MIRFVYYFKKKTWQTALTFLAFKGLIQEHLVKTSTTHNKHFNTLTLDSISAKSAAHVFSLNVTYTFRLSTFLMIVLCSSWGRTLVEWLVFLLLILFSYQKTCVPYLPILFDIHHFSHFYICKPYLSKSHLKLFF